MRLTILTPVFGLLTFLAMSGSAAAWCPQGVYTWNGVDGCCFSDTYYMGQCDYFGCHPKSLSSVFIHEDSQDANSKDVTIEIRTGENEDDADGRHEEVMDTLNALKEQFTELASVVELLRKEVEDLRSSGVEPGES